jgi:hypothetical protein
MAAADREVVFGPNDLRAGLEAAGVNFEEITREPL